MVDGMNNSIFFMNHANKNGAVCQSVSQELSDVSVNKCA